MMLPTENGEKSVSGSTNLYGDVGISVERHCTRSLTLVNLQLRILEASPTKIAMSFAGLSSYHSPPEAASGHPRIWLGSTFINCDVWAGSSKRLRGSLPSIQIQVCSSSGDTEPERALTSGRSKSLSASGVLPTALWGSNGLRCAECDAWLTRTNGACGGIL